MLASRWNRHFCNCRNGRCSVIFTGSISEKSNAFDEQTARPTAVEEKQENLSLKREKLRICFPYCHGQTNYGVLKKNQKPNTHKIWTQGMKNLSGEKQATRIQGICKKPHKNEEQNIAVHNREQIINNLPHRRSEQLRGWFCKSSWPAKGGRKWTCRSSRPDFTSL